MEEKTNQRTLGTIRYFNSGHAVYLIPPSLRVSSIHSPMLSSMLVYIGMLERLVRSLFVRIVALHLYIAFSHIFSKRFSPHLHMTYTLLCWYEVWFQLTLAPYIS